MSELKGTRQPSGELVGRVVIPRSTGGATEWSKLLNKPFETIGTGLKVEDGTLMVDTADEVERDNTKPITAAAVYTEVGNINALLATI